MLYFLLEGYMARWGRVCEYLVDYNAFINKFKELPLFGYNDKQLQWIYDFANDPDCAPSKTKNQVSIIKNFCVWINCIAKFSIEKTSAAKLLT